MDILVFEFVNGGGLRHEPLPPSLAMEGDLMLRALLEDLLEVAGVRPIILRDDRRDFASLPRGVTALPIAAGDDLDRIWQDAIRRCDAIWPIAPETGGVLERLCRDVEQAATPLLNSPADAVAIAASKLATARALDRHHLPVVPTRPLGAPQPDAEDCVVVKPDDGAGCEGARIVRRGCDFAPGSGRWVVQPLLQGDAVSLSALFAQGRARLLSCNRQHVENTGDGFALRGCAVNALDDPDGCWQTLACGVAAALPDLWGYAGLDLIMTADGPVILEVNPRLTTSYAGLKAATGENPAAMVLGLHRTARLPPPRTHRGTPVTVQLEHSDAR
ncbi:ATP-grasp domain-containing protein [Methylococcus geothermalis]|uniref:ATP-grasp domain-containing protein n=1 Tax=Methylococcus geothermalis TaxID=2681310 RepID=A0A858Q5P5_9GAMM|nr:ATP-grasp domain-containing protein [Methylococcus geothermalis]QJD29125.1 ATP-grasp domain-containing protein [Methylococcus geothermalis]